MSTVATTPNEIAYFRLASLKGKLKLESIGMKTRGGALRPQVAAEFGLKARDKHSKYITEIERRMEELIRAKNK